jgi:hypothetical protein
MYSAFFLRIRASGLDAEDTAERVVICGQLDQPGDMIRALHSGGVQWDERAEAHFVL